MDAANPRRLEPSQQNAPVGLRPANDLLTPITSSPRLGSRVYRFFAVRTTSFLAAPIELATGLQQADASVPTGGRALCDTNAFESENAA